ncbi:MAG: hypothetical protein H8D96_00025 [Desulfobacterales bacterium]|uniref:FRG domain-containing protein n=1 Tax=Candidatus Desulfatibia vada TaxID=2841696 RepID=A0A8J6NUE6_9BACT|nr:hypothetical protein [Candidatus Desulfatibia vada]
MEQIRPKVKSTECSPDGRQWVPSSFENLLTELDYVVNSCESDDPATFYRGQTNYEWPLDSTFVRESIKHLFGIEKYHDLNKQIRQSQEFHRAISSLLLLKFGTLWKPSQEALDGEKTHNIDPWFELLKNLQQYPEKDNFIKGTFLVDWTGKKDIGLYFATFRGKGTERQISKERGALWICDAVATGKVWQIKKLGEILDLMKGPEHLNAEKTFPLIFHPPKQTFQARAANQMPVYISQMDFRYDLADIWASYENAMNKRVFITLIITEDIKKVVADYLDSKGITEKKVYPE